MKIVKQIRDRLDFRYRFWYELEGFRNDPNHMVKLEISNENLEAIIGHREVFDRLGILDVMLTSSIRHHYFIITVIIMIK